MSRNSLFSIDINAHLDKLARHTYRSRFHYPVELVRLALQRGAGRISIKLIENRIELEDDGPGIPDSLFDELNTLINDSSPDSLREQAIQNLQDERGIGLLAVFSPSPSRIIIENATAETSRRFEVTKGQPPRLSRSGTVIGSEPVTPGTRMVLFRRAASAEMEKRTLKEYCRGVGKEIRLNGELISRQSLIRHALVRVKWEKPEQEQAGEIAIPRQGDTCRIWLMNQGIPLDRKAIAPWRGLVFDATIETRSDLNAPLLDRLVPEVRRLYLHLISRYPDLPESARIRTEELLFKHHRMSGDSTLVERPPLFSNLTSKHFLTLDQLKNLASSTNLFAIPSGVSPVEYQNRDHPVLQLSNQQADYLINHVGLPIRFLPLPRRRRELREKLAAKLASWKSAIINGIYRLRPLIPAEQLSDAEKRFILALSRYLNSHPGEVQSAAVAQTGFIRGRGLLPGVILKDNHDLKPARLVIHRRHPLVKKAIQWVNRNPENIDFVVPLFQ